MIPKLYDNKENYIGELSDCIRGVVIEERNGMFEAELEYQLFSQNWDKLVRGNIIVTHANDTLLNQKFRIYKIGKTIRGKFTVFAKHISYDMQRDMIEGLDISNQSCEYCLNMIFRNSQFSQKFKGYSNIINAQNFKIGPTKLLTAIGGTEGSIIDTFGTGAELLRDNENIHILNKRGNDNGVIIEYAENLTGLDITEDEDGLITRIRAKAKYTPEGGEETEIFTYVDSSHIFEYETPFIGEIDFSDKFEDGEIPTVEKLTKLGEAYFRDNKCDIFEGNYKIQFIPLSKCAGYEDIEDKISLCDTVTIKDYRYNLDTKAKVIKATYDFLRERYESMEVGQPRTTLGDVVGGSDSNKGEQGPPGPQGPPGKDGDIGDFPDSLPKVPVLSSKLYGFASIELSWTYENKVYYNYELYASKTKDFTPNVFDIIHAGQSSSFLFQAKPNETWYFRVCAVNSHGNRTAFSSQIAVTTKKIDDLSNYVDNMAIGEALIGTLSLDRGWIGKLNANYLDVKGNLSVTDGNGKRTLDIDSFGNVSIDASELNISGRSIDTITTEKAQTEVNNLKIGGRNLLRNTMFEDAKAGTQSCPNWWIWGDGRIYTKQGQDGYNWENAIYLEPTVDNIEFGISQDILVEYAPRNTEFVLSGEIWREVNVKGYGIYLEFYDSNYIKIDGFGIIDENSGYGYFDRRFVTSNTNYTYMRITIVHKGVNNRHDGSVLLFPRNLMLEKGNKASTWRPDSNDMASKSVVTQTADSIKSTVQSLSNDVYHNYATKSEVTQTANDVRFEFKRLGTANLQYNGNPTTGNTDGYFLWQAWKYTGAGLNSSLGFVPNDNVDAGCLQLPYISAKANTTYSLKLHICPEGETNNYSISIKQLKTDGNFQYQTVVGSTGTKGWHTVRVTFQTWDNVDGFHVEIWSDRRKNWQGGYVTWISEVMVFEGSEYYPESYVPYIGAINSNTTIINGDGVNVKHNDGSRTNLNSHALNFYTSSNNLYSQVYNGTFSVLDNNGNKVGFVGRSMWTSSGKYLMVTNAEYGSSVGIGAKYTSSTNSYSAPLVVGGGTHDNGNTRIHSGLNMHSGHCDGVFKYYTPSGGLKDDYPSLVFQSDNGEFNIYGDNGICLGVRRGSENWNIIKITEYGDSPKGIVDVYGNLNMNNWTLSNARSLLTLDSVSLYSRSRNKDIKDSYGVMSLTDGDIRYTDRETYHTSKVNDGYECYIELPYYLAENIENNYHVNISKRGFGDYRIKETNPYYFILESDRDNFAFTFEVVAKKIEVQHNNSIVANNSFVDPYTLGVEVEHTYSDEMDYWKLYSKRD